MSEELQRFFGFTCDPFGPVGRPTTFVETERSLQLSRNIVRELAEGELILSVRGRPGSGKTILVAELARDLKAQHLEVLEQSGKSASPLGLQRTLADAAGVRDALITPDLIYLDLWGRPDSPPFVLLIDDADQLSTIMFRFLEVLMQFSRKHGNNLRIVLVGCYGIWAGLEDDDLDRLRIAAVSRYVIGPLDSADATAYLDGRLRLAGSSLRQVMTRRATVAFVDNVEALPSVLHAAMACVLREGHSQGCKRLTSQIVLAALGVTPAEHEATTSSRVLPLPAMAGGVAALAAAAVAFVVMHGYPAAEPHPTIAMSDAVSGPSSTARPDDISPGPPPRTTKLAAAVPGKPSAAVGTRSDPPSDAAALDPLLRAGLPPPGSDPAMTPHPTEPVPGPDDAQSTASTGGPQTQVATSTPGQSATPAQPTPFNADPSEPSPSERPAEPKEAARRPETTPYTVKPPTLAQWQHGHRGSPGLVLVAGNRDDMASLFARVYRGMRPPPYADVVAANHLPVKPGDLVVFPEPPDGWGRADARAACMPGCGGAQALAGAGSRLRPGYLMPGS